ncbi:hypothetical protein [Burkholderia anthina]|uniref:hypothetical protein n=1 Tax=Burkholderia anthina TaxID=179879 RepID=UPI00158BD105|nr:hypothetical protein [Burkholderia anthina]
MHRADQASDLAAELVKLPEADALAALGKLHASGALDPPVSAPVFALLVKDTNPAIAFEHDNEKRPQSAHRDRPPVTVCRAWLKTAT